MNDDIDRLVDAVLRKHVQRGSARSPSPPPESQARRSHEQEEAAPPRAHGSTPPPHHGTTTEPHEIHHLPSVLVGRSADDADALGNGTRTPSRSAPVGAGTNTGTRTDTNTEAVPPRDPHARLVTDPVTGRVLPDAERIAPIHADPPLRIVVIDNYDSFTYNLVQYLGELGATVEVHRNDAIDVDALEQDSPDGIVISPGPGNPKNERDFGVSGPILLHLSPRIPTLGVCLGLQGFAHLYGGDVTYARAIMHGKTSRCDHDGKGLFTGIPSPITVGRYHSLVAAPDRIPADLEVSATSPDGEIMGLRHRSHPIECVQFHPESILTEHGKRTLANFLQMVLRHRDPSTPRASAGADADDEMRPAATDARTQGTTEAAAS